MTHQRLDINSIIHEHGYRLTPQRQFILDAICESGGHTTVEQIYQRVHTIAPSINLATVYRTLDFLCELRLVVAADIGGGRMVYEIAGEIPHHHLVCRQCGKVESISHETVVSLFSKIEQEQQFTVDMDHLALFGLCQNCKISPR